MSTDAAKAPPTRASKAPHDRARTALLKKTAERKAAEEAELVRWTPEEVVQAKLLPYRSVRMLKEACYRRRVVHHNDGGRITFTADDIREENARRRVAPLPTAA